MQRMLGLQGLVSGWCLPDPPLRAPFAWQNLSRWGLGCIKTKPPVTAANPNTNPKTDPSEQSGLAGANHSPGRVPHLQGNSRVRVLKGLWSSAVKRGQGRGYNPTPAPVTNPTRKRGVAGAGPIALAYQGPGHLFGRVRVGLMCCQPYNSLW